MGFVNYNNRIVAEQEIRFNFFQQNSISHELDLGLLLIHELRIISYLIPNCGSQVTAQFIRHPLRKRLGCYSPWLSNAHQQLVWTCSEFPFKRSCCSVYKLGYLSTLSWPCRTADDWHEVIFDILHNFSFVEYDRQLGVFVLIQASELLLCLPFVVVFLRTIILHLLFSGLAARKMFRICRVDIGQPGINDSLDFWILVFLLNIPIVFAFPYLVWKHVFYLFVVVVGLLRLDFCIFCVDGPRLGLGNWLLWFIWLILIRLLFIQLCWRYRLRSFPELPLILGLLPLSLFDTPHILGTIEWDFCN